MKYDLMKPCASCPFRRVGIEGAEKQPVRLLDDRIREIVATCQPSGATFQCHETVPGLGDAPRRAGHVPGADTDLEDLEDDDAAEVAANAPGAQHCAGALIFALKHRGPHQHARIMGRLGAWHPRKLEPHFGLVFDTLKEFLATSWSRKKGRVR